MAGAKAGKEAGISVEASVYTVRFRDCVSLYGIVWGVHISGV